MRGEAGREPRLREDGEQTRASETSTAANNEARGAAHLDLGIGAAMAL